MNLSLMTPGEVAGAAIAALASIWGGVLLARMLKSSSAGPYSRQSQPVNYWARILSVALFVVACLSYFVGFILLRK